MKLFTVIRIEIIDFAFRYNPVPTVYLHIFYAL